MDQNVCTACELAKAKKKSHTPGTRTKRKLSEMLHIDNHEKNILSYQKNKYSFSVVEDYSKMDLSEFLKKKSDAGEVLINLIAKLQRQLDVKVKIIQCNSAWEFVGPAMKIGQYCAEKGIHIRFSSRDDSAENGIAECANETR